MDTRKFFLTGDFNQWSPSPAAPEFRLETYPYGRDEWGRLHPGHVSFGSYTLTLDLPAGRQRFKLLQGEGWGQQWTTMAFLGAEQEFEAHTFLSECGLEAGVVVPRGSGELPHAEVELAGGPTRFDFCPAARTLAIHQELERAPGPSVAPWIETDFACDDDEFALSTWLSLPAGHRPERDAQLPVALVFDGRSQLYGEDPELGLFRQEQRQLARLLDPLVRQGLASPWALLGIEVPRQLSRRAPPQRLGLHDRRRSLFDERDPLHEAYRRAVLELVARIVERFPQAGSPAGLALVGHSWGADFALRLAAEAPGRFGAVLAQSPSRPLPRVVDLAPGPGQRLALIYGRQDLGPFFLTEPARCRSLLDERGIQHLIQWCPEADHDPTSLAPCLPGALAFVFGRGI